ncbi:MAG TPA: beta-ketoacyl-[acyl-carrier-protein] synthase family protein [Thermoanaerobaculia bacterium]|nr:beta-ketoacyl-[acyl-carrier-protein] synthase family protein [Thermoanaerobaculia bacterium]
MPARRVVITGLGCLSPNGNGREAFAAGVREGASGIDRISLFDPEGLPVTIAGELKGFDPTRWIGAKDIRHVSRAVPMAIAASTEALDDAGVDPTRLSLDERREFGVVLGTGGGAIEFTERMYHLYYTNQTKKASIYAIPSGTIGTLSSEISMQFGLRGLSHVVSTGCASSTDALGYAFRAIKHGVNGGVFLAGGVDATVVRGIVEGFVMMRIVSTAWETDPPRASRPFSADRDGFVLGEGAWMFVLEERERALARGAKIYGEIRGYGATCDAYHRVRLDESGEEPARAMMLALEEAGLPPEAIDYLAYHGTSTALNDRVETRAVRRAFGAAAERLPGSSIKSMIGHPQGACGAAGVAATLLGMRESFLPPTINLDFQDSECDLDYVANESRNTSFENALCNTIGFGSKNSALVISQSNA